MHLVYLPQEVLMRKFREKSLIILFCLYNTYIVNANEQLAYFFAICVIISLALNLMNKNAIKAILYVFFGIMCFSDGLFLFYLPLILYNLYFDFPIYTLLSIPLLFMEFQLINFLMAIVSVYIAAMTKKHLILLDENKVVRDELKEETLYLQKYNEQLKIDKEKNIHIAILTERNRIAREIHDSIGHGISSSILQVEALKIISSEDKVKKNLDTLQETLKSGMEEIRKSIHNLYNESFDLESQVQKLCNEIPTIDIELTYRIEDNLGYDLKFNILSVVKEGITNCIKHSNASKLKISLLEQPKFYSIVIKDNGSDFNEKAFLSSKGIGLISIKEIADRHNGFVNCKFDEGFRIHLTLMKG
ncbi:hypothetical protein C3E88_04925 [Clostridium sp. Cult3]|nr:hypothetical protein [Clostridium sp. Cult3]